jgi:mono/diheme cytochrome c family protein
MTRVNWILLVALLIAIAANFAFQRNPAVLNYEYLPEMVRSKAYESFSLNPVFTDGKTMQPPVAGTLPRGFRPVHYRATPEDAQRAGRELQSPVEAATAGQRGLFVFQTFCLPCHGPAGRGDGPVALRGYPAPPSLLGEKTLKLADGQMFHILTFGQKNMPAYAGQISQQDRWRVIAYVRSLQQAAGPGSAKP